MNHDLHRAPRADVVERQGSGGASFSLVRLQWGKNDIGFSLHAEPTSYSTYGIQTTDFLNQLGFRRSQCGFIGRGECYVRPVDEKFDFKAFLQAFPASFNKLLAAQQHLERCGIVLDRPEGWGYFNGSPSSGRTYSSSQMYGDDGHTANGLVTEMKSSESREDPNFKFIFTWRDGYHKGWTIHYTSKHGYFSSEIEGVFKFLGMQLFAECPQVDFNPCWWRFIPYESHGDSFLDNNANIAHSRFDQHSENFSPGIKELLGAQSLIETTGIGFLTIAAPKVRLEQDLERQIVRPITSSRPLKLRFDFDVCISFAGTEREHAEQLAAKIQSAGFAAFYDKFYEDALWGKDLAVFFHEIYSKLSRFCVIFVSDEYNNRMWTIHERRAAQERALKEKGNEYILPIRVGTAELAGMPSTIGYVSLEKGIEKIADLLIKKLAK